MKIEEALKIVINIRNKSEINSFIKIHTQFIQILSDLKSRDLTENQKTLIEVELDEIILKIEASKEKKQLNAAVEEFKKFLNEKLSLISEGHYTSYGMVFGMLAGTLVQMYLGYLSMLAGMIIGLIIGMLLDAEAQKQGRVLKTKVTRNINDKISMH